jgi:hypothetical protein
MMDPNQFALGMGIVIGVPTLIILIFWLIIDKTF